MSTLLAAVVCTKQFVRSSFSHLVRRLAGREHTSFLHLLGSLQIYHVLRTDSREVFWKQAIGQQYSCRATFITEIQNASSPLSLEEVFFVFQLLGECYCWWTIDPRGHMRPSSTVDFGLFVAFWTHQHFSCIKLIKTLILKVYFSIMLALRTVLVVYLSVPFLLKSSYTLLRIMLETVWNPL